MLHNETHEQHFPVTVNVGASCELPEVPWLQPADPECPRTHTEGPQGPLTAPPCSPCPSSAQQWVLHTSWTCSPEEKCFSWPGA